MVFKIVQKSVCKFALYCHVHFSSNFKMSELTESARKKQRTCKDALFTDRKHHLNQSHTFTIGKAPHSIQCHGFLFSLYILSPLIHRFEEKKHWWKETVLLPEVSFDSPMAHETFRFLWNSFHGYFYRFLPKLTEGELKEGQNMMIGNYN
jgi:hypothetical protein